ncbi:T9SS type B sorting domain-containing protein [Filimonas lacunae]|uniref:T9SS type B sorting domain-containing protein n=1 Tax=Filimonas lacunae TaxID=477680 RepID=UPI000970292D|nr:gliding motility-associated C-terminal domain-containing protein [Filimonas lacunae]
MLLILLFNSVQAQTPLSGVYTINPALAAGGRNFQTFERAAIALDAGISGPVVFNVAENSPVFEEQVNFYTVPGASTINTITINGNGNTLHFLSTNSAAMAGIKLDGARHFIIDSLIIKTETAIQNQDYGVGIQLLRDADSNTIRKCKVIVATTGDTYQQSYGIAICGSDDVSASGASDCNDNIISGNTIIGGGIGIYLTSFQGYTYDASKLCSSNQVINNAIKDFYQSGIELATCANTLIQGNEISSKTALSQCFGINLTVFTQSTTVSRNIVHDLGAATGGTICYFKGSECYYISEGLENVFVNNLAYSDSATDNCYGFHFSTVNKYVNVYHNTVYFKGTNSGNLEGFYIEGKGSADNPDRNYNIGNNIVYIDGGVAAAYGYELGGAPTLSKLDRNNIYLTSSTKVVIGKLGSTSYTTLATWQAKTKFELSSTLLDPLFTDIANKQFKPTEKNIDNRGIYVGVDKDFSTANRSKTSPDLGAYEFLTAACSAPVVAGTTLLSPATTVCEGADIGLNLSGNSAGSNQTTQWVRSTTENGTYTNLGSSSPSASYSGVADSTMYIKAMVTCGTDVKYSDPVLLTVNYRLKGHYTINKLQPTSGTNFASFGEAVTSMTCGINTPVVFDVVPGSGPYNEAVVVPAIPGTSVINTVTFNGNGETLSRTNDKNIVAAFDLNNTKHIILYNLNVEVTASTSVTYSAGIRIRNFSDSNVIRKCKVTNSVTSVTNQAGIVIGGTALSWATSASTYCNDNIIDSNVVIGGGRAIFVVSIDVYPIYRNHVTNNKVLDFGETGIYTYGTISSKILNNDISRPTLTVASTGNGIYGYFGKSLMISGNRIHNLADGAATTANTKDLIGIYIAGSDPAPDEFHTVQNNLIYNFNSAGKHQGLYNSGVDNVKYYHNTVVMDDVSKAVAKESEAFILASAAIGIEMKNNLFILGRNTTTASYVVSIPSGSTMEINNNDYYYNSSYSALKTGKLGSTVYATLANWRAGSSQDAASVAILPVFTDVTTGNYKPTAAALSNKGAGVGVVRDILGTRRNTSTPDVGAYEFSCTYPLVAAAVVDSIAVCTGSSATFNVKDPESGTIYQWFDQSFFPYFTEGTMLQSGNSFTTPAVTDSAFYYLEAIAANGCGDGVRVPVKVVALAPLETAPIIKTVAVTGESASFAWEAVPDAKAYLVSRNYVDFITPNGSDGLSHVINGLKGGDTVSLVVKATAILECQAIISDSAFARTFTANYFVPNMFTPNGDGKNDELKVYGNTITSLKMSVFNQWGEKVFETADRNQGWNGSYSGKQLPVGVYIYVVQMTFSDGTVKSTKGTVSLIR